jgi:peptide chain release factor 3
VLTAVDSALMVIDVAKGVEERTIKLMEVCRLRDTPIMSFINKLDREGKDPIDLLDEVESGAGHPVRAGHLADRHGQRLKGVVHLVSGEVHLYEPGRNFTRQDSTIFPRSTTPAWKRIGAEMLAETARRAGAGAGRLPPVRPRGLPGRQADAGVLRLGGEQLRRAAAARLLRRARALAAPARPPRAARSRPGEPLTGFVFKIQANMDPQHRDRVAFMRVCSGHFTPA